MNNFHRFQNFRQFSNLLILFSQFDWKSDTRHSSLESAAKSGQNFIKNSQKKCKIRCRNSENEKIGNSFFIREKMLTMFGWNFEIWAVQKYKTLKCKSCRSRQELSNEYFLAKIGVDTAENEPLKVWEENSIHHSFASLGDGRSSKSRATALGSSKAWFSEIRWKITVLTPGPGKIEKLVQTARADHLPQRERYG